MIHDKCIVQECQKCGNIIDNQHKLKLSLEKPYCPVCASTLDKFKAITVVEI